MKLKALTAEIPKFCIPLIRLSVPLAALDCASKYLLIESSIAALGAAKDVAFVKAFTSLSDKFPLPALPPRGAVEYPIP